MADGLSCTIATNFHMASATELAPLELKLSSWKTSVMTHSGPTVNDNN